MTRYPRHFRLYRSEAANIQHNIPGRVGPIQLSDLVVELNEVNWHKLGLQLKIPSDKLDKIDEDHRLCDRKLSEVLLYWLRNEHNPSWDKICDVLQRMGGFRKLAHELRIKYCSLKTCLHYGKHS